jgi:anti-sigma regulatory factor (Ser/Thr protein kinase)
MKAKKLKLNKILKLNGLKRIEVPTPNYDSERRLTELIVDNFREKTSKEDLIESIRFISGEMINNARFHGNHLDTSKKIILYFAWKNNDFYFVVEDEGKGFDMKNPSFGGACFPERGLGIDYSKQKADLIYNFRDPRSYVCLRVPKSKMEAFK